MAYIPYNDIIEVCEYEGYNYELLMSYKTFAEYLTDDEHLNLAIAEANGWDTDEVPLEAEGFLYTCNLTPKGVWIMGDSAYFVKSDWFYLLNHSENIYVRKIYDDDRAWEMVVNDS